MIIPSMTSREMYDNLINDQTKVNIKKEYYRKRSIKELRKSRHFPAYITYDYNIPASNNRYVIYFYAESRFCVDNPIVGSFCVFFEGNNRFVVTYCVRGYKHTPNSSISMIRQISAYTSHFFQRYNERFLKDNKMSSNEVACVYLSRNPAKNEIPIKVNEEINRNCQKYGECGQQAIRVRDGICFTHSGVQGLVSKDGDREKDKVESMCVVYTTFLSKSELSENQQIAIDNEHISCINQFVTDIQNESKDGVITLRL